MNDLNRLFAPPSKWAAFKEWLASLLLNTKHKPLLPRPWHYRRYPTMVNLITRKGNLKRRLGFAPMKAGK